MSELLKVINVRKMDSDDKLDIYVSVLSKRGNKYDVRWAPEGGVASILEFDSDKKIYEDKKIKFDNQIKGTSSVYILSNAAASEDQYGKFGPALKYLLPIAAASEIAYGFNPKKWTEGDAFLNESIKIMEKQDQVKYEVFQDSGRLDISSLKSDVPEVRNFGFDPYFLDNGAKVIIKWTEDGQTRGGREWSTSSGNELQESRLDGTESRKFKKRAEIWSPDDKEIFYLGEDEKFTKELNWKEYDMTRDFNYDLNIFLHVTNAWEKAIPGYYLSYPPKKERTSGLTYKSPFDPSKPPDPSTGTSQGPTASPGDGQPKPINALSVKLPEDILKAKTDLPPIEIIYTDPKAPIIPSEDAFQPAEEGFILDGDNLEILDEEYAESDYAGEDESAIEIHQNGFDATLPAPILPEIKGSDGKPNTDPAKGPVASVPASASALSGKIKVTVGGVLMSTKSPTPLTSGGKDILHWTHRPKGGWLETQKYPEPGEYLTVKSGKGIYGYSANINGKYYAFGGGTGWANNWSSIKAFDGNGKTIVTLLSERKHYINCDMVITINGKSQPVEARAPFDCKVVGVAANWGNISLVGVGTSDGKAFNFTHCTSPAYNTNNTFINKKEGVDPGYSKDLSGSVKVGKTFKKGEKMGFFQGNVCPGAGSGGVHFHLDCLTYNDLEQYVIDLLTLGWYDS